MCVAAALHVALFSPSVAVHACSLCTPRVRVVVALFDEVQNLLCGLLALAVPAQTSHLPISWLLVWWPALSLRHELDAYGCSSYWLHSHKVTHVSRVSFSGEHLW